MSAPMVLAARPAGNGMALRRGEVAPLDRLLIGRPLAEVAVLLPRLFGLCRSVQEMALALASGQGRVPGQAALGRDILRDHLAKFYLSLPRSAGMPPAALPEGWQQGGDALRRAVFGPLGLPDPARFEHWLQDGQGIAPVIARIATAFAPGDCAATLPAMVADRPFGHSPVENSLALRHRAHPLLAHVEARWGHGPLAHATARLIDLDAVAVGHLPAPARLPDGTALVPCSRGICALRITLVEGVVSDFARRTPTDDLLAEGGLMERALALLPADKTALAPLLVDLLDPCVAVTVETGGAPHA